MRINRLKISGFKSFVDPITLTLPGNLTGVVGPNGCGKSNIIDALIWVMGESSAKHLRGDSMADVIFNGSNTRKPVGQATVEIIFDNTDGTIGGQYAGFGEISIKRSMSRDAVSSYFLNGARCRRKDITNVFLGTGIGARGYSVIEQGMISRVIEARPEELRSFLEEAAGISKYKERRRETENRMRHARENIERLDDIREELEKQLNHLQRQARAAERYQVLKADERALQAKLLATRWRTLDRDRSRSEQLTAQRQTELEAVIANLREVEAHQAGFRESQVAATEAFNRVQADFYARSGDITRLEQAIRHSDERAASLRADGEQATRTLAEIAAGVASDTAELNELQRQLADLEPAFAASRTEEEQAYTALQEAEQKFAQWQQDWDAFNRDHSELARRDHAAQIRLEHLLEDVADHDTRKSVLAAEAGRNDTSDLGARIDTARADVTRLTSQRDKLLNERNSIRANLGQARGAASTLGTALHEKQSNLEEQRGRYASLKAVQEAALGGDQEALEVWLRERGIVDPTRLAETIEIEAGWEAALESALRLPLGALCGPDMVRRLLAGAGSGRPGGRLTAVDQAEPDSGTPDPALLAARVRGPSVVTDLLRGIYTATDQDASQALLARLTPGDIVVLPDGTLLGHHWCQLPDAGDVGDSILARERQLAERASQLEVVEAETANLRAQYEQQQQRLKAMEQDEHRATETLEEVTLTLAKQRDELGTMEAEFRRREARAADVLAELERIAGQSSENLETIEALRAERAETERSLAGHEAQRETLNSSRAELQQAVDSAREAWRGVRETTHEIELKVQAMQARAATLDSAGERNNASHVQLEQRCGEIASAIKALEAPREQMATDLEQALAARLSAETALNEARRELGTLDESLQESANQRARIEQEIAEKQQTLEQVRLDQRALEVRMQELGSRFEQTGENFEETLAALGDDDTEASVEAEIEKMAARIARLGPINLAAIDEFNQLTERKTYLDQQHADLTEALTTLEEAIRKIDRETRTRFKETYDKVNNGLQAMFPVLFGGGHAYLELTGDDLLETGVTVMARPPGKRNSTIHLLSGGEKALTALAFVFSIFELNPAPFCLLDEVDAPLDDANVVRLTEMLKNMAANIQFLFISHNKITMEIAEQLVGVTMQEAGVSRLVAVNMEQAVELAASA